MNKTNESNQSVISEDLIVEGNIETSGSVGVSGKIKGNITVAILRLEAAGKIKGNVKADDAVLLGHQLGKVSAKQLTIHSGAVINGAVTCDELIVECGASISGKFRVGTG
jgi:cytoskeletal protein CcmA (bactofilin family)